MNTQHTSTNTKELNGRRPVSRRKAVGLGIVVFLSSAVLSLLLAGGTVQADALPPRPATPVPLEQPTSGPVDWSVDGTAVPLPLTEKVSESAAYIELSLPVGLSANAQTVVQWQDKQGGWHDVDGWQQRVASSQIVRWAVYPRDFGTGPFRWALYSASGKGGQLVAASTSFNLPCCYGNTVRMDVATVK